MPDAIWDVCHPEQRLAVRATLTGQQLALMGQKRRGLHELNRKRPHPEVGHRNAAVAVPPAVRQDRADVAHRCEE